jgi:hypothetical protein
MTQASKFTSVLITASGAAAGLVACIGGKRNDGPVVSQNLIHDRPKRTRTHIALLFEAIAARTINACWSVTEACRLLSIWCVE